MRIPLLPTLALGACLACASSEERTEAPPTKPDAATEAAAAEKETAGCRGVLVPAELDAISLWPEAYKGELLVLEVVPAGTAVEAGEVLARLDARKLEEEIADAALELSSARIKYAGLLEKNLVAEEAATSKLARTRAGLVRARRSLEGYETRERDFSDRSDGLSRMREKARIEDQLDELAQLEAMYEADELTDATEEIVLKRSRRNLSLTEAGSKLSEDRRGYKVELTMELELESKRENVEQKEEELRHLIRTQGIDATSREDAVRRSKAELDKKEKKLTRLQGDLELMTLIAPRAGILLHGTARDVRTGGTGTRLERGSTLSARKDVLVVANPDALAVALDVPESLRAGLGDGTQVTARLASDDDVSLAGKLSVAAIPAGTKGEESTFAGTVTLDGSAPGLALGMHVLVEPEGDGE